MDLWVVGRGGLLGSAIVRQGTAHRFFVPPKVPWADADESSRALSNALDAFNLWRDPNRSWGIVWAAGAGVIASSTAQLTTEADVLTRFAQSVAQRATPGGAFLFASSASVYGASGSKVCDELTPPAPLNGYARTKLAMERRLTAILHARVPLAIARISTLYGPGQNLDKGQGLVSAMCSEVIRRQRISIYVPLDTIRDYLYADDAANQCLALIGRTGRHASDPPLLRVVASRRSTSIAEMAGVVQAVSHRRAHILQIRSASSSLHVSRLILTSIDPAMRTYAPTSLPSGVHAVHSDLLRRFLEPSHYGPDKTKA